MVQPRKNLAKQKASTLKELVPGSGLLMSDTGCHPGFRGALRSTLTINPRLGASLRRAGRGPGKRKLLS